jgi:predicted membrane channel-forming protein YqfA (hemolysin III family)
MLRKKIRPNLSYIEDWLLLGLIIYIALIVGSTLPITTLNWWQTLIPVVVFLLIAVISWTHLYFIHKRVPSFDIVDLVISIVLAVLAVVFFLVEYNLSPDSYWLTHSLWHIFAALSQLYLLESRNKNQSGLWVLIPETLLPQHRITLVRK